MMKYEYILEEIELCKWYYFKSKFEKNKQLIK